MIKLMTLKFNHIQWVSGAFSVLSQLVENLDELPPKFEFKFEYHDLNWFCELWIDEESDEDQDWNEEQINTMLSEGEPVTVIGVGYLGDVPELTTS